MQSATGFASSLNTYTHGTTAITWRPSKSTRGQLESTPPLASRRHGGPTRLPGTKVAFKRVDPPAFAGRRGLVASQRAVGRRDSVRHPGVFDPTEPWSKHEHAARMYNHIVDTCPHVEEALTKAYRSRLSESDNAGGTTSDMNEEGNEPSVSGSADKSAVGQVQAAETTVVHVVQKEVKGDTTHLLERCTEVDASTKAKYTVKRRNLDDDTSDDHVLVASAPSTNVTMTSPVVSPSREAASDVAALPAISTSLSPIPRILCLTKFNRQKSSSTLRC
ncbi:hypothetical protein H257_06364 [Aphanomyces astaci]|uniref:Uncharacterized protein n=1 Tax=Aphanomyces astaci TaxID=112090 RepID=W4GPV8_APHAT|nr:hypothetical protein H257_06364 [Aphanomyces astaci]ETV80913.1 hypothetical protein H257_06364 [Aphanomyces astaci]|eukprot:XP_009829860.1 hypothetical protein H257_06364 [Aphanomyces astaci]